MNLTIDGRPYESSLLSRCTRCGHDASEHPQARRHCCSCPSFTNVPKESQVLWLRAETATALNKEAAVISDLLRAVRDKAIQEAVAEGFSLGDVAKRLNLSKTQVAKIVKAGGGQ